MQKTGTGPLTGTIKVAWQLGSDSCLERLEGEARADHLLDGGSYRVLVLWCMESGKAGVFRKDSEGDRVSRSSQVMFSKPVWRHKVTSVECLGIGLLGNHPWGRRSPRAVTLLVMGIQDRGSSWGLWKLHQGKSYFHRLLCPKTENAMAAHSSTLAWRIPARGEPGGLPSLGLHRAGHDWSSLAAAAAAAMPRVLDTTQKEDWPLFPVRPPSRAVLEQGSGERFEEAWLDDSESSTIQASTWKESGSSTWEVWAGGGEKEEDLRQSSAAFWLLSSAGHFIYWIKTMHML